MWRGGQRKREGGGTGRGGVGFASSARGYHSLEQAESDSVRRRRKDEVRKWPEERPHSRQFSRPFSRVPMSFKRRLPPLRQATNVLRGSAPTSHPLPPARVSSRGLAGQPIARRVESRALYPTPPPQPLAFLDCSFPFGGGSQWGVEYGFQDEARPTPLPPRTNSAGAVLPPAWAAPLRHSCCCPQLAWCRLFAAWTPVFSLTGLPATQLSNHSFPFMFFPPRDFPFLPSRLFSDCAPFLCVSPVSVTVFLKTIFLFSWGLLPPAPAQGAVR